MAVSSLRIFSDSLALHIELNVWLPDNVSGEKAIPVLYLLHGLTDDHNGYLLHSPLMKYVNEMPVAVVMPQVHRSYYTDMKRGGKYWTFVSQELPQKLKQWYRISDKPEDTFVAGLSMGGYAALKWALRYPHKIKAAWALSPAVDITDMRKRMPEREEEFQWIFGSISEFESSENNLFHLLRQTDDNVTLPAMKQYCGRQDYLYEDNKRFQELAEAKWGNYEFYESDGEHDWDFWYPNFEHVFSEIKQYLHH